MLQKVESYCRELLSSISKDEFPFHNIDHTVGVVKAASKLAEAASLSTLDRELLLISAWFHDVGYLEKSLGHETVSMRMAREFLSRESYPSDQIEQVVQIISATQMPQKPKDALGEFLADADLSGLGSKDFFLTSQHLRHEHEMQGRTIYETDRDWLNKEESFSSGHQYFTRFAQEMYGPRKEKNRLTIEEKLREMGKKKNDDKFILFGKNMKKSEGKSKAKDKEVLKVKGGPKLIKRGRGVESLFRVSLRNHISLSAIADRKANILLSTNAIIISVSVSVFMPIFEQYKNLLLPMIILMVTNILTIIFTILATRPNITNGQTTKEQIENQTSNLTFFGNFYKMDLDEYLWGMDQMINDEDFIYKSFSRDLYFLGKVLAKKYFMLRKAYTIFMFGLILTTIAFVASVGFF